MEFSDLVADLDRLSEHLIQDIEAVGRVVNYLQSPTEAPAAEPPYEVLYGSVPSLSVGDTQVAVTSLPVPLQRDILKTLAASTLAGVQQRASALSTVATQVAGTIESVLKDWK